MPFGMRKKDKEAAEEKASRSSLFSRSKGKDKAAAPESNPYAAQSTPDPYGAKPQNLGAPPAYDGRSASPAMREKSPVPPGGYGGSTPRFGGSSNYAQQGGYGSNPYGSEQPQAARTGGYGGLGRRASQETVSTDVGRAALFGDAPQRQQQQQLQATQAAEEPSADNSYANSGMPGGYGGSSSELYGQPDRYLTAEEQEEEDVKASKDEIKFIKQQDVSSTRNARRIAEQAEATGRETLARLGVQGERIHNTERNLDMAQHQNRLAEEKARELKTLNRSMFAMHVSNPFTAKKREEAANAIALEKHRVERERADDTRQNAYSTTQRHAGQEKTMRGNGKTHDKATLANRAKYQFEADSEDEAMEGEIEENLDIIHRSAKTLHALGNAMGDELDEQNKHIGRIIGKTETVDDQIAMNRIKLNRIR
ncbi:plasma membrane snare protein-like protein [Aureobasidium pullulans]|uniref:Plasma membrane snare protein-like protein n=1 Tax=Aureobasidium pullulans TaxID=5580 RepID=A0A4S9F0A2_AURPU|nr:plasma membrane snare protein-like protein [Aureobasidium pullulans]